MKTILFAMAILATVQGFAQDRWTVQLNSKTLLMAKNEDTAANTVAVHDLKKGSLIVTYVPAKADGERKRQLMVFDADDQQLYSKEAFSIVIPTGTLKKWRLKTPRLYVYTLPVLGEAGATVRLRRVHLCTVNFE